MAPTLEITKMSTNPNRAIHLSKKILAKDGLSRTKGGRSGGDSLSSALLRKKKKNKPRKNWRSRKDWRRWQGQRRGSRIELRARVI
jgi:hypothetical protein